MPGGVADDQAAALAGDGDHGGLAGGSLDPGGESGRGFVRVQDQEFLSRGRTDGVQHIRHRIGLGIDDLPIHDAAHDGCRAHGLMVQFQSTRPHGSAIRESLAEEDGEISWRTPPRGHRQPGGPLGGLQTGRCRLIPLRPPARHRSPHDLMFGRGAGGGERPRGGQAWKPFSGLIQGVAARRGRGIAGTAHLRREGIRP